MIFDHIFLLELDAFSTLGDYFIYNRFNVWQTSAIYVVSK